MMSEEYSENGRVEDREGSPDPPTPDINSPRHSLATPPGGVVANGEVEEKTESSIEFFGQKGGGMSESGSEGESSPRTPAQDKDNASFHSRAYVTVSVSPDPPDGDFSTSDPGLGEVVRPKPRPRTKAPQAAPRGGATGVLPVPEEGQDHDMHVTIEEREKVGFKSDIYISYKVCTESTRSSEHLEKRSYTVWRRYRDFEWLREMLEKHNPTLIVPPLPGKQLARYFDQKSEEFLDERQRALAKFLKRLSAHPYFSFDRHLMKFITAEPEDFVSYVTETSGSNRLLGAVTSGVKMAANTFRLKNPDPEYAKEAKYFEDLCEKLGVAERISARLHTEREELKENWEEFASGLLQWSLGEPQLVTPIRGMSSCVENCCSALETLNANNACSLLMTAKEYQLYCIAGVSAVRRRDGLQLDKERAEDERQKRKKFHDEASKAEKLQKLPKLAEDLEKAVVEADRSLDNLTIANEKLRVDIEKWTDAKDREVSDLCCTFADNHISYHQKCFNEWEKVLAMLRDPKFTPSTNSSGGGGGERDEDSQEEDSSPYRTVAGGIKEEGRGGASPLETTPATLATDDDVERSNSDSPDLFT